jgi:hypothetical protein
MALAHRGAIRARGILGFVLVAGVAAAQDRTASLRRPSGALVSGRQRAFPRTKALRKFRIRLRRADRCESES